MYHIFSLLPTTPTVIDDRRVKDFLYSTDNHLYVFIRIILYQSSQDHPQLIKHFGFRQNPQLYIPASLRGTFCQYVRQSCLNASGNKWMEFIPFIDVERLSEFRREPHRGSEESFEDFVEQIVATVTVDDARTLLHYLLTISPRVDSFYRKFREDLPSMEALHRDVSRKIVDRATGGFFRPSSYLWLLDEMPSSEGRVFNDLQKWLKTHSGESCDETGGDDLIRLCYRLSQTPRLAHDILRSLLKMKSCPLSRQSIQSLLYHRLPLLDSRKMRGLIHLWTREVRGKDIPQMCQEISSMYTGVKNNRCRTVILGIMDDESMRWSDEHLLQSLIDIEPFEEQVLNDFLMQRIQEVEISSPKDQLDLIFPSLDVDPINLFQECALHRILQDAEVENLVDVVERHELWIVLFKSPRSFGIEGHPSYVKARDLISSAIESFETGGMTVEEFCHLMRINNPFDLLGVVNEHAKMDVFDGYEDSIRTCHLRMDLIRHMLESWIDITSDYSQSVEDLDEREHQFDHLLVSLLSSPDNPLDVYPPYDTLSAFSDISTSTILEGIQSEIYPEITADWKPSTQDMMDTCSETMKRYDELIIGCQEGSLFLSDCSALWENVPPDSVQYELDIMESRRMRDLLLLSSYREWMETITKAGDLMNPHGTYKTKSRVVIEDFLSACLAPSSTPIPTYHQHVQNLEQVLTDLNLPSAPSLLDRLPQGEDLLQLLRLMEQTQPPHTDRDVQVCKICFEGEGDCVLVPCGHLGLCLECSSTRKGGVCPFCRVEVEMVMKTFKHQSVRQYRVALLSHWATIHREKKKRK
ncbi:hypothetical protein PROFUN_07652 [Planoprotostelium fungivorum]|uniref:RING-type domain-containing protein n=1 Tax=Planoprotostelium fungivorum TaxID=1890364 RepID=A0A2P6NK71_9EUKA|nr:hypothetical protein PROFUN_07652 [Planoprotostelium fungivorum]